MRAFNAVFLNRVTPTAVRNAACFIAAASISVGMLYVAKKEADKNHAWYLSLSPEKQKEFILKAMEGTKKMETAIEETFNKLQTMRQEGALNVSDEERKF